MRSFQCYREFNKGAMPNHIFIYRDGVGDSMRQQVIDFELEQLNKIIQEEYGFFDCEEGKYNPPKVTLIIVNKRVRQRFFQQTHQNGQTFIDNPP
jgi:hypothetical protein